LSFDLLLVVWFALPAEMLISVDSGSTLWRIAAAIACAKASIALEIGLREMK